MIDILIAIAFFLTSALVGALTSAHTDARDHASESAGVQAFAFALHFALCLTIILKYKYAGANASGFVLISIFVLTIAIIMASVFAFASAIHTAFAFALDLILARLARAYNREFAINMDTSKGNNHSNGTRKGSDRSRSSNHRKSISWLCFVLDEEQRRHLMDFRQQWWKETRSLCKFQRRWIIFWKTRSFEAQVLWAISVIKLQEMLGLHRLP